MDGKERERAIARAWHHALAELRDRHRDEFNQLHLFYRNLYGVPITRNVRPLWSGSRPEAPPYKKDNGGKHCK